MAERRRHGRGCGQSGHGGGGVAWRPVQSGGRRPGDLAAGDKRPGSGAIRGNEPEGLPRGQGRRPWIAAPRGNGARYARRKRETAEGFSLDGETEAAHGGPFSW